MRVLMLVSPVDTHFGSLVPLAWALRAADHELLVAGQPDVAPAVRSVGLTAVSIGEPFGMDRRLLDGLRDGQRPLEVRPRPAPEVIGGYAEFWGAHARQVVAGYLALAREYRPDLIVADVYEYCSLVIGGVLGVPVAHHRTGVDPISGPSRPVARRVLRDLCGALGLAGLPDPTLLLDPCPPALQVPDAQPGTPVRYVRFNGGGSMPGWLRSLRQDPPMRTRVAVSIGSTLRLNGASFMRHVLRTFAHLPGTEAVATVDARSRAEIGQVPDNVRMVDPVPLNLLLPWCGALVDHGGAGTTMAAISLGLPQLIVPQMAEQFALGDRLVALGAGISIDDAATQNRTEPLRDAVAAIVSTTDYATAAGRLGREMALMPTLSRVVGVLERLPRESPPVTGDSTESRTSTRTAK